MEGSGGLHSMALWSFSRDSDERFALVHVS